MHQPVDADGGQQQRQHRKQRQQPGLKEPLVHVSGEQTLQGRVAADQDGFINRANLIAHERRELGRLPRGADQ